MENLKKSAESGFLWTTLSTGFKSLLQLIQLIILARFLSAEDFGLIAIVMVVIGFSQLFMDMGISNAIIYKQNISSIQLSSLYWLNLFSGILLTISIFFISPLIAAFYSNNSLIPLLRILSLSFFFNAIGNQYKNLFRKNLKFKLLAKTEIISNLFGFFCTIILAMWGFGAYSLIFGTLIMIIIANLIFLSVGFKIHKPKLVFRYKHIKSFLNFGIYQMAQNSIVYFINQFDIILIGKLLGTEAVGVYSLIKQIVMRPSQIINPIITSVSFPIMSKLQHNLLKLKEIYLKIVKFLSSINSPIYLLMIVLANFILPLILGNIGNSSVELFQILSMYALLRSLASPAGILLLSKGRADIGFWWSVGELILLPTFIFVGSKYGIIGTAFGLLLFQIIIIIPTWYVIINKMCNASFTEYMYSVILPIVLAVLSMIPAAIILLFVSNNTLAIVLYISIGLSFYIMLSNRHNKEFIYEIKSFVLKRVK